MSYFNYKNKQLYYAITGVGQPLIFLHGNTASGRMFEPILPLYAGYQCILLDFLGYGRSDRMSAVPENIWVEQAQQTLALIKHLQLPQVALIGTSGGAWVALNTALLAPAVITQVVADSFDGRSLHPGFREALLQERQQAVKDLATAGFYEWCNGPDWRQVVAQDTQALLQLLATGGPLFAGELSEISASVLLLASVNDPLLRSNIRQEYQELAAALPQAASCFLTAVGHPALLTEAEAVAQAITTFLE